MSDQLKQLSAILFSAGAPVTKKKLMKQVQCTKEDLEEMLRGVREIHAGSLTIVDDGELVTLVIDPSMNEFIESMQKDEESSSLSVSAQETLAIIAYAGLIDKVSLDFLRGVNTQYILRRLAMRGLVRERKENGKRLFSITVDFLRHLGIEKKEDLPDYEEVSKLLWESVSAADKI